MIYLILRGRIGNQLFQFAAAKNLQIERGMNEKIIIDDSEMPKSDDLLQLFKLCNAEFIHTPEYRYNNDLRYARHGMTFYQWFLFKNENMKRFALEKKFEPLFRKMGYIVCWNGYIQSKIPHNKNVLMEGYFQSPLYFEKNRDSILQELDLTKIFDEEKKKMLNFLIETGMETNTVCVHVRRGDYVGSDYDICNENYYYKAMDMAKHMLKNSKFYVFSDDIDWCKERMKNYDVEFISGNRDYEDLYLMSLCKHFILSNSSFSWWAQYYGKYDNKVVIAPSKWMKKDIPQDMYGEEWKLIEV